MPLRRRDPAAFHSTEVAGLPLRDQWVRHCLDLSQRPATFYSGCRKILRGITLSFPLDNSLQLSDAGYTSSKLRMLERNYIHQESIDAARKLWEGRVARGKYGSVGFTTYGHFVKGGFAQKRSKRASVMGPCIQSVVLTLLDKKTYAIDVAYRTTEVYKKFPADIAFLRDTLLSQFKFKGLTLASLNCNFANITVHPMYWVTIAPHLDDPAAQIAKIKDDYFRAWIIKWTARYICPEYSRGIQKFAQALRVRKDALERLDRRKLKDLQRYLRAHHPGHRNDYEDPEEDE